MRPRIGLVATAAALLAAPAPADRIVTATGQVLEGKLRDPDGKVPVPPLQPETRYRFALESGTIYVPGSHIRSFEVEGDMADYVPRDDKEREMLDKGFVRFEGKWISKDRYALEIEKRRAGAAAKLEEERRASDWANAREKETAHFRIRANVPQEVLDEYADLLEAYYATFFRRFKVQPSPTLRRTKMRVNLFKNREDYVDSGGAPSGTGGYFSWLEGALNFYHDAADREFTRQVMLHEATHLLTYLMNPELYPPTWLNEGVAEYFGSAKVEGGKGKLEMTPGQILDHRLLLLQQEIDEGKAMTLESVLSTPHLGYRYRHYAYGWAFCHFLFESPKYGRKFDKFFKDVYGERGVEITQGGGLAPSGVAKVVKPEDSIAYLKTCLGVRKLEDLEKEWHAFVRAELKAERGRGYFFLGRDLYQMAGRPDADEEEGKDPVAEAIRNLDRAIEEMGYRTPDAYYYRALAHERKGNDAKAIEDIRVAIDLDPTDAILHAAYGGFLPAEKREEALQEMRIACELDPTNLWLQTALELLLKGGKVRLSGPR
jgi:tetratricopeptide (TPR) repeat protein